MFNLSNKVAIVTGARQGMGKAHAFTLAEAGAKVVISDLSLADCQKVAEEIEKKYSVKTLAIKCDVSQKEEVENLVKETINQFKKIDILVNNAGICQNKPFLELTEEDWEKTININLKGEFLMAQEVAKEMIKQKSGSIINIASIAMGQEGIGFLNLVHYCASKGGVVGMTEAMALELAPYNIRVNAVAPGIIETPMINFLKTDSQSLENSLDRIPLRRLGKPEEVSNLVLFLASDESSYITGSTLVIDGGYLAG
ncbi:MAG TPA: SDR family NAD(P)-dependent oxidoreductase [Candidatus Paceibacterota bacterium]|jgi:NAD(P)-dependent dehydrogenase (short-subunit alcohol dehydrogenase family)|nr:SDR family NAD(P)-dependent oxidoreductase [Candidatus Paceibacterota bacterium]HPQ22890.1 SDR family NAD(P)-dependent oxidoreductase [Candidatus Paceibacterota bacterium]